MIDFSKRTFIKNPAKASPSDPQYTFEDAQNEIGQAIGVISSSKNMTQAELQCQAEILDLLPSIEEANMISIAMDKKVKFSTIAVPAESRYISLLYSKNFDQLNYIFHQKEENTVELLK